MARRHHPARAAALGAVLLLTLTACGGAGEASDSASTRTEDDQLAAMVSEVEDIDVVEWHGQLLTADPDAGGRRLFDLDGRYSASTGDTELSMDSVLGGAQQVDYRVLAGRTYFNSEAWGPSAADCWVDITDDKEGRNWALPLNLDPTWPVASGRAVRRSGDGLTVTVPAKKVLSGMPRGLVPTVPASLRGATATALITPHGRLIEVGLDIHSMWSALPEGTLSGTDARKAGWWVVTMEDSQSGAGIDPPKHVFDPKVTPPTQCRRS